MSTATSLPEVFTTVSAGWMNAPDLAAGDLFGAGMSNMLTLDLIDLLHRQKRVWQQAALGHMLTATLAMLLTGLAVFFVLQPVQVSHVGVGLGSLTLFILYVLGMRLVFRQEDMERRLREQTVVVEGTMAKQNALGRPAELRRAVLGFSLGALALLVAAHSWPGPLPASPEATGTSTTFIGTSLVAITTSSPELVTAVAAVRLGAFDLPVGNLFGSNAFNMAAFLFADLAYRDGGLLGSVSPAHALTALWSVLMMNIGLMGIIYRAEKRFMLIEPDSLLMIVSYVLGLWLLFR